MYLLIRVTAPILCLGFRLSPVILVRSPSQSLAILCCCSAYFIPFLLLLSSPRNTGTCIEYPAISPLRHLAAHSAPVSLPFQHCACARPVQRSRPARFPQRASSLKFQSPRRYYFLRPQPPASLPTIQGLAFFLLLVLAPQSRFYPHISRRVAPVCVALAGLPPLWPANSPPSRRILAP